MLLWSLYVDQPCSRQDLSEATGLSSASVSNVIRELIHEGIVVEAGSVDSDGGRPRVLLRINPDYGHVVGIDVGETRIRVELFDLTMAVRVSADIPLEPREHGVDVVVDRILRCLSAVLADSGVPPEAILGVGVGVPGVVEHGAEVMLYGQTSGWDAVPLERLLRAGTDLPLCIDNGANTMGLAEQWFGAGQGARHRGGVPDRLRGRREHHRQRRRRTRPAAPAGPNGAIRRSWSAGGTAAAARSATSRPT